MSAGHEHANDSSSPSSVYRSHQSVDDIRLLCRRLRKTTKREGERKETAAGCQNQRLRAEKTGGDDGRNSADENQRSRQHTRQNDLSESFRRYFTGLQVLRGPFRRVPQRRRNSPTTLEVLLRKNQKTHSYGNAMESAILRLIRCYIWFM